jgi:Zn-finger protein
MCYLCLQGFNPFEAQDPSRMNTETKKKRAKEIKDILKAHSDSNCDIVLEELEKLKEEQYSLSKEI